MQWLLLWLAVKLASQEHACASQSHFLSLYFAFIVRHFLPRIVHLKCYLKAGRKLLYLASVLTSMLWKMFISLIANWTHSKKYLLLQTISLLLHVLYSQRVKFNKTGGWNKAIAFSSLIFFVIQEFSMIRTALFWVKAHHNANKSCINKNSLLTFTFPQHKYQLLQWN